MGKYYYRSLGSRCFDLCKFRADIMIGSNSCKECNQLREINWDENYVVCPRLDDKQNLSCELDVCLEDYKEIKDKFFKGEAINGRVFNAMHVSKPFGCGNYGILLEIGENVMQINGYELSVRLPDINTSDSKPSDRVSSTLKSISEGEYDKNPPKKLFENPRAIPLHKGDAVEFNNPNTSVRVRDVVIQYLNQSEGKKLLSEMGYEKKIEKKPYKKIPFGVVCDNYQKVNTDNPSYQLCQVDKACKSCVNVKKVNKTKGWVKCEVFGREE